MSKNLKRMALMVSVMIFQGGAARAGQEDVADLKKRILALATAYQGQGDPDQSKQRTLEPLVQKLVRANPMPPVRDRIPLLAGAWKQVWGPYDYRNSNGGVDPKIGVKEIYQVVSADGYYYNVAPYYPDGDGGRGREQVGLLRGEFKPDLEDRNGLRVKFTDYPGVDPRPSGVKIWELAALAEAGRLPNPITIVPRWVVKTFFGGGKLEEAYTDRDLRIVYGTSARPGSRRSLYVMTRASSL